MTGIAGKAGAIDGARAPLAGGWPAPAPGAAGRGRRVAAQSGLELRLLVRNGEQLLLILIIPVLLLVAFGREPLVSAVKLGHLTRIDFAVPGILALAALSTAFTSQAIATGFERRYGVLKRLGSTPLSRAGLVAAKTVSVCVVEAGQAALVLAVGAALGWRPSAGAGAAAWTVLLLVLGTAAFSGLGLLLAGTLRAEGTLAAANLLYLVQLGLGGIVFPLTLFPAGVRQALRLLPAGALSNGLRSVLAYHGGFPARDTLVLLLWAVAAIGLAARTFRWE